MAGDCLQLVNHTIGEKFVEIYHDGIHPVVPPGKMYEGLVDSEEWYQVIL